MTTKRRISTGRKTAAKATKSSAVMLKEYAALRKRALRILKDLNSSDAAGAKRAAEQWGQFHADSEAWTKRHGTKLVTHVVKHKTPRKTGDRTPRAHGHSCAPHLEGTMGTGKILDCYFRRYSRLRGECLYNCFVVGPVAI